MDNKGFDKLYVFRFKDGHEEMEYGFTAGEAFRNLGYDISDSDLIENYWTRGERKE